MISNDTLSARFAGRAIGDATARALSSVHAIHCLLTLLLVSAGVQAADRAAALAFIPNEGADIPSAS